MMMMMMMMMMMILIKYSQMLLSRCLALINELQCSFTLGLLYNVFRFDVNFLLLDSELIVVVLFV